MLPHILCTFGILHWKWRCINSILWKHWSIQPHFLTSCFYSDEPVQYKERENASCLGPLKNVRLLLSAVHLAQMDSQIQNFLCKSDAQQCFESAQALHISVLCFGPGTHSLPCLQSVAVRPDRVTSLFLSRDDQF